MGDREALVKQVADRGFVRVSEPTSGAGGMIIAAAHAMSDAEINYQEAMHVTAIDIDRRCVHMTYLQLALLHVPAIVIHGNALSLEEWEHWFTPAHALGGWSARLRQREALDAMRNLVEAPAAAGQADVGQCAVEAPKSQINEAPYAMPKAARQAVAAGQMSSSRLAVMAPHRGLARLRRASFGPCRATSTARSIQSHPTPARALGPLRAAL